MKISLETVRELAPDQVSLTAAKKLLKPAKWPVLGQTPSLNIIWSECQGSGANPYYSVVDAVNYGDKCTCPSRKFPCKHVLALLWQYAESGDNFADKEAPEWATEWLGRRRHGKAAKPENVSEPNVKKDINATVKFMQTPMLISIHYLFFTMGVFMKFMQTPMLISIHYLFFTMGVFISY